MKNMDGNDEAPDVREESKQDRQIRELTVENAELKLQVKALTAKNQMYLNNWVIRKPAE